MDNGQYLLEKDVNDSLSYQEFVDLCENLVAENKTTGPDQTENHIKFTKLNYHRLKRITKTLELDFDTLVASVNQLPFFEFYYLTYLLLSSEHIYHKFLG